MDIVGPFPISRYGRKRFILVVTDYFTKWVEAEAYERIREQEVERFLWKHVICRFGIPKEIVTDNGPQFITQSLKDFCRGFKIKLTYSTPRYPQANGLAEATNKTILDTLRRRLEEAKGLWPELLLEVLWSFRTTPRMSTLQTPFAVVYGAEAMLPAEREHSQLREHLAELENRQMLVFDRDTLDETRERASSRMRKYQ